MRIRPIYTYILIGLCLICSLKNHWDIEHNDKLLMLDAEAIKVGISVDKDQQDVLRLFQETFSIHRNIIEDLSKQLDLSVLDSVCIVTSGYGHGSGVVIGPNLILTAGHCINGSKYIELSGERYDIVHAWQSDKYDIGFIEIDGCLPCVQLGEMPNLLDRVYLVGAPYEKELKLTITKGIISHLNRDIWGKVGLIQTDAEGAPGSSGCPLFDVNGKLLGICITGPTPGGGVSLCEPISHIKEVLDVYMEQRCLD